MTEENEKTKKAMKPGTLLPGRPRSQHRVNIELESKIRFSGHANFFICVLILLNIAYLAFSITRGHPPAAVFFQYYSDSGQMIEIKTVYQAVLGKPLPRTPAPSETIVDTPPFPNNYLADILVSSRGLEPSPRPQ